MTWKGAFRLFLYWLYRSLMNDVRATAVVGSQWKERGEGVGKGARTSSGKRGFQVLNFIQDILVVLGFLDIDEGVA